LRALEQMHYARAKIEPVQNAVPRDHDRDQAEPERLDHCAPSLDLFARTMIDFTVNQKQKQDAHDDVQSHESHQREQAIAGSDARRRPINRAHDPVDQPRLPAKLGGHTAGGSRDAGKWQRQHQNPQERSGRVKMAAPKRPSAYEHERDQYRSESDHDVIAVVRWWNVVRPLIARKIPETFHFRLSAGK